MPDRCALEGNRASFLTNLIVAFAMIRVIDMFFDLQMLAVFGNDYGKSWIPEMGSRRAQRTILLDLLMVIQLVFWYAIVFWGIALCRPLYFSDAITSPGHALQLAFSSATTIGYGTYAPTAMLSIWIALFEFMTVLCLVAGLLPTLFGRSTSGSKQEDRNTPSAPIIWESGIIFVLRSFLPIVFYMISIFFLARYLQACT
jgi:hypothetical protein